MKQHNRFINDYFISSTFRDMQQERDILNNRILPELRELANKSGRDISLVDLRWGISTEALDSEEGMRKVLSVCMELIDECMPYYIVLIGEKYGTVPSLGAQTLPAHMPLRENSSITEMEIYRAIQILEEQYADTEELPLIIAMRDPLPRERIGAEDLPRYVEEDPAAKKRLDALRAFLETKYAKYVFRYEADWDEARRQLRLSDSFAENMTARLKNQLIRFLGQHSGEPEQIRYLQDELYRKSAAKIFCGREDDKNRILQFAEQFGTEAERKVSALFLHGPSGTGKSTLMAYCAQQLWDRCGTVTVALFCGNGSSISGALELQQHLIRRLEAITGYRESREAAPNPEAGKRRLERQLDRLSGKHVIIFIDGLDCLYLSSGEQNLDFLPRPEHCKYIISTADERGIKDNLLTNASVMELTELSESDMAAMIDRHLHEMKKDLSQRNRRELIRILRYRTPLYLKLVLIRLSMLSQEDFARMDTGSGESYFAQLLQALPDREEELGVEILLLAGQRLNIPGIEELLFICSRIPGGCRTDDIVRITQNRLCPLDINIYLRYVSQLLSRDMDGVIRFTHSALERGARAMPWEDQRRLHLLCDYVQTLADGDLVKTRAFFQLCVLTSRPEDFGAYMANVFHGENQKALAGEVTADSLSDRIIESMKKYCRQYGPAEGYAFIRKMLQAAEKDSVEGLYRVISALLFSYDKLFEEFSATQIHALMRALFEDCIGILYPRKDHDWQYLRLVYVCCEQCSFRASDEAEREEYVQLFFRYCQELYEQVQPTFAHYDTLTHDLCMACKSVAALYERRNFRYCLSMYDRAIALAGQYDRQRSRKGKEPVFCEPEMRALKGAAVIDKAFLNRRIGWEEKQSLTDILTGAGYNLKKLLKAAEADLVEYAAVVPQEKKRPWAYSLLCEYYRYAGDFQKEAQSILCMIACAEQCYRKTGDILMLDTLRNGWLRLAMMEDPEKPVQKRISEMEKSLMYLRQIEKLDPGQHTHTLEKIKEMTLKQLFEWYFALIGERGKASAGSRLERCRLCGDFLTALGDDLPALLGAREGEQLLPKIGQFRSVCKGCIESTFTEAANAASGGRWDTAIEVAEAGHRLAVLLAQTLTDMETQLYQLWQFGNLLTISYRNKRQQCGAEYYEKELEYAVKLESYILHADDPAVREQVRSHFTVLELYRFTTARTQAWLHYVNWCLQPCTLVLHGPEGHAYKAKDQEKRREKLLKTAARYDRYRLPGQGIEYFMVRGSKNIPEDVWTTIGSFLSSHFEDRVWKDLLQRSDLLEAVTLEYVYQHGDRAKAGAIVANGYDDYMELPVMYLMRKYDRKAFERLFEKLKPICMKRHGRIIKKLRFDDQDVQAFLKELLSLRKGDL